VSTFRTTPLTNGSSPVHPFARREHRG